MQLVVVKDGKSIMVVHFERFLFDLNEGLHHMGLLSPDIYIDEKRFIVSFTLSTLLTCILIWVILSNNKYLDTLIKYIPYFVPTLIVAALAYFQPFALLLGLLALGFMRIIFLNEKYAHIKEKIERFF